MNNEPDNTEDVEFTARDMSACRHSGGLSSEMKAAKIDALMRLAKRMLESDRESWLIGLYCVRIENPRSEGVIERFIAKESTGTRSEWADQILMTMMERSIFTYWNYDLAAIIRAAPLKNDPLKHLDYQGRLCAACVKEGQRRQILIYLQSTPSAPSLYEQP